MPKPGTYRAIVSNYALARTKKGDPQAVVEFTTIPDGQKITYYGHLSEKSRKYTVANLIKAGLRTTDLLQIGKGLPGKAFEPVEVEIVIKAETFNGKEYHRIRYINKLGSEKFETAMINGNDPAFASLKSLEGEVAAEMLEQGVQPKAKVKNFAPTFDQDENLPF